MLQHLQINKNITKTILFLTISVSAIAQTENPSFEYRESYFPMVSSDKSFQKNYHTMPLDNYWGLWGHNLHKWITEENVDEEIYAWVNEERNLEQYCFSSKKLKKIIAEKVEETKESYDYFMVAPNDNTLVCLCDQCKKAGNTKNDASPAVFQLLNELAKQFPENIFFTTAYLSIKEPPSFQLQKNVGVFYSTIDFQYGKAYKELNEKERLITDLKKWKNKVSKLYVWEYALNYDNYFDFYPNLRVLQDNLKFLKSHGANGVFFNGSESYSVLQDIKCAVIASLLYDVNLDLKKTIEAEIQEKYPESIQKNLSDYYVAIQDLFYDNPRKMGIYEGIADTQKKYLDPKQFNEFYQGLVEDQKNYQVKFNSKALTLSATFLKLELMRLNGLKEYGYGNLKNKEVQIKPEVKLLLDRLEHLVYQTKIKTFNEQDFSIKNYIELWESVIVQQEKYNRFLQQDFKVLSELDEGYNNQKILNDGAYGFLDYNTNWLISSLDENLKLQVDTAELKDAKQLKISFLNDPRHNILLPCSITIKSRTNSITRGIEPSDEKERVEVEIPISISSKDSYLTISIEKSVIEGKTKAMACDEIRIH